MISAISWMPQRLKTSTSDHWASASKFADRATWAKTGDRRRSCLLAGPVSSFFPLPFPLVDFPLPSSSILEIHHSASVSLSSALANDSPRSSDSPARGGKANLS